jgi:hypothetical protein
VLDFLGVRGKLFLEEVLQGKCEAKEENVDYNFISLRKKTIKGFADFLRIEQLIKEKG